MLPTPSVTVPLLTKSRRIVPSPLPVLTLTVYGPLPVTPLIDAPLTPVVVSVKSPVSRPLTLSPNETVKLTDVAFVGCGAAAVRERAAGGVWADGEPPAVVKVPCPAPRRAVDPPREHEPHE